MRRVCCECGRARDRGDVGHDAALERAPQSQDVIQYFYRLVLLNISRERDAWLALTLFLLMLLVAVRRFALTVFSGIFHAKDLTVVRSHFTNAHRGHETGFILHFARLLRATYGICAARAINSFKCIICGLDRWEQDVA